MTKTGEEKKLEIITIFVVLVISMIIRLPHFYTCLHDPYVKNIVGDELFYHKWALAIADGNLMRGRSFFTTPLYAYFLGGIYYLAGVKPWLVLFINTLMGAGSALFIYLTARHLSNQFTSLAASILFSLCLTPLFYESFPEKTTGVLFLTAVTFYLIYSAFKNFSYTKWTAAGIAAGLAALAHALLLVYIPSALLCIFLVPEKIHAINHRIKAGIFFLAGALIAISPATIHNYYQDKDFVLITYNGGQNFYTGNHHQNLTGLYTSPPFSVATLKSEENNYNREAERLSERSLKPSEVSSFWYKKGWEEIKANPALGLNRFWNRMQWTTGAEEISDTRTYEFYRERLPVLKLPLWGFGIISMIALTGCVLFIKEKKYLPLIIFSLFYWLALSCFFVYGRYRLPLIIPFTILAAAGLSAFVQFIRNNEYGSAGMILLLSVFFGFFVFHKVLPDYKVSYLADYYNQGSYYAKQGKIDLAIAEYEKALSDRPGHHPGWEKVTLKLADLYEMRGRKAEGVRLLQWAIKRNPQNPYFREKMSRFE